MKHLSASPAGVAPVAFSHRRSTLLLATASAIALLGQVPPAVAVTCGGAPPADVATPAALYETLRDRTDAQLLAIGFAQQPADCAWVYEVKMLTTSGSVVELDFDARGLGLIGARGPDDDKEVARLVRGLGGNAATVLNEDASNQGRGSGNDQGSGSSGHGSGDDGGDDGGGEGSEGGEGGNSGSGSSGGGGHSGSGGGGGEGGEGGGSGSGGSGGGGEGGGDD